MGELLKYGGSGMVEQLCSVVWKRFVSVITRAVSACGSEVSP